jgi:cytochrome oxidase Cu insertion factor (SCO1/SenC/PrrC family)
MTTTGTNPARGRRQLLLVAGLFLLPVLAAYVLFGLGWRPEKTGNHGELVSPARPVGEAALMTLAGGPFRFSQLQGKWTLVYFGPAECRQPCADNLYKMRQAVRAQGKEAERVQQVFIVTPRRGLEGLASTLKEYPDVQVLTGAAAEIKKLSAPFSLPAGTPLDGLDRIYLVDPLGNFILSYPAQADATGLRKDLARLLRVSRVG